jgi:PQQ-like domain
VPKETEKSERLRLGRGRHSAILVLLVSLWILPGGLSSRAATAAPSAGGDQLWLSRFDIPQRGDDIGQALTVSPDGTRVFVTGAAGKTGFATYRTIAYDTTSGAGLWVRKYDGPGNGRDQPYAIGVSSDGSRAFVTGQSTGSGTGDDWATVAYDAATGATLWGRRQNGSGTSTDGAYDLAVSSDGARVYVTGFDGDAGNEYLTIAYDAVTGATVWVRTHNGGGGGSDEARSVTVSPDGSRVYVTGYGLGVSGTDDWTTIAYDAATGNVEWAMDWDRGGGQNDYAYDLSLSPDGSRVFVTGLSGGIAGGADYATIAYDAATGGQLWVELYDGPASDHDASFSVGVSPDGSRVFVTGDSVGLGTGHDYLTIAYDAASGTALWTTRYYNAPVNRPDYASSLVASPDGTKVFVTGWSIGLHTAPDYATLAYDATDGTQLWVARYDGPASSGDEPIAVGVSPDAARVFITGSSTGIGTGADYTTIAYEP